MISFRTTKQERRQLKEWTQLRGFRSMSEFIRNQLGFELGLPGTETIQEVDELDNFETMARAIASLIDRVDELQRMTKRIAAHLGANRAGELPVGITGDKTPLVAPKPVTPMPEGFSR